MARASINKPRTAQRIVGRLERVRKSLAVLDRQVQDLSIFSVEKRRRIKAKAIQLREEESQLARELKGIRDAINSSVDA